MQSMDKTTLRVSMKERRNLEPIDSILEKSKQIEQLLTKQPIYHEASSILFYISYGSEVYTHNLVKQALQNEKTVLVPISDTETKTLQVAHIVSWDDLAPSTYNILEPRKERQQIVPLENIDLIIVPGIAFDTKGNRLGHGGGYYDWLLSKLSTVPTIGLAFSFQIVQKIPVEPNDQPVKMIITEKQIIDCLGDKFR